MVKKIYIVSRAGVWNGQVPTADYDPRQPLPPGAFLTDKIPPELQPGEVAIRKSDGGWRVRVPPPLTDPPSPPVKSSFTQAEFFSRLTDLEIGTWVLAIAAAKQAPAPTQIQVLLVALEARFNALPRIDLTNPQTRAGLALLTDASLNILTAERLATLLDGIPERSAP